IETADYLRRTTFDIIGHAGAYFFNALEPANGKPNELNAAFIQLFHSSNTGRASVMLWAQAILPVLKFLSGMSL
ncbi:hypothetical protein C8J57DRAFT_1046870, partial [Mycena rebaudengoi]